MNRKLKYEAPELEELEMTHVGLMAKEKNVTSGKKEDLDDTEEEDDDI